MIENRRVRFAVGALLIGLFGCSPAQEADAVQPRAAQVMPTVADPAAERRQVLDALTGQIADLRRRLDVADSSAQSHSLEMQAVWSVTLRVLRRRLAAIEERVTALSDLSEAVLDGAAWDLERGQIEAAAFALQQQFEAELEALSRSR